MQRGTPRQKALVQTAIETGAVEMLEEVITIVKETGALDFSRRAAAQEAQRAITAARKLPPGEHAACLIHLAGQLLERDN